MRCLVHYLQPNHFIALAGILSAWMLAGCHNQTSSFTNPFMPPDRVPPPPTRPLTPGTAQPYYPGGPVQPAPPTAPLTGTHPVAGQPTVPPGTFATPPATSRQAPSAWPTTPTAPAAPAAGWNVGPRPAAGSATRNSVYGGQPTSSSKPSLPVSSPTATNPSVLNADSRSPQVPVQTILPAQHVVSASHGTNASNQAAGMASDEMPQRPVAREITTAELRPAFPSGTPALGVAGFRPQGSTSVASAQAFETQPIVR